jgi:site-specific DNA-methyltransferase (adenine-specific)/modification methylase
MLPINKVVCEHNLGFLKKLPENSVDLVVTDPPYNISQGKNIRYHGRTLIKEFGDWDHGFDPEPVLKEIKRVLKRNGQIYIFCGTKQISQYMRILRENWFFRNLLIWYKRNPAPRISKTNYLFACEYIIYGINEPCKIKDCSFNFTKQNEMHNLFITNALQGKERLKDGYKSIHPTQKPLEILKKLIEVSSDKGDIVLDPFMGVGSTAHACLLTGRKFLGCDIDPKYVHYANKRIAEVQNET